MMRIKKLLVVVGLVASLAVGLFAGKVLEKMGDPDPTDVPGSTESYTLEDIYNRLVSGAGGTKAAFAEPAVAAGTATMHTLDQIMKKAPEEDTTSGATTADVMADKKFWGLTGGQWGLQTGDGDPNLVAGNIKDGVTIFGVTGELHGGCTCSGTLVGTRWCDNGDGTVTDLTTCLVWLKDASWGERRPWRDPDGYDDAHKRAGILKDGTADAELSDSSVEGDWRLPTLEELKALTTGTEPVSSGNMQAFSGVQADGYWSSTTFTGYTGCAWFMALENGEAVVHGKGNMFWVWPVRAGQ